jgi:predicted component of type VI protein secretion system
MKEYGENVTSYYWKKFECEICKQSYPYIFKRKNKLYKLIDVQEPAQGTNFILLESMPLDKNTSRNIHMLTVTSAKSEFKLGRGHESEVRINDISVSRCHAIIKCKKDGFYIEDNLSKFGTIVLMKERIKLAEDHTMAIQVGRSVISFTIKNIDAREKLKREIEPLLNRNRNRKPDEPRAQSEERPEESNNGNAGLGLSDEFTSTQGRQPGKSVAPISRGLTQPPPRNEEQLIGGRSSLLNEPSPYHNEVNLPRGSLGPSSAFVNSGNAALHNIDL